MSIEVHVERVQAGMAEAAPQTTVSVEETQAGDPGGVAQITVSSTKTRDGVSNAVVVSGLSDGYQSGPAEYRGVLPGSVSLTAGARYYLTITVSGTANDVRMLDLVAQPRGAI